MGLKGVKETFNLGKFSSVPLAKTKKAQVCTIAWVQIPLHHPQWLFNPDSPKVRKTQSVIATVHHRVVQGLQEGIHVTKMKPAWPWWRYMDPDN